MSDAKTREAVERRFYKASRDLGARVKALFDSANFHQNMVNVGKPQHAYTVSKDAMDALKFAFDEWDGVNEDAELIEKLDSGDMT